MRAIDADALKIAIRQELDVAKQIADDEADIFISKMIEEAFFDIIDNALTIEPERKGKMKLIVVTCFEDGKKAYINPSKVCAVYPNFKNPELTNVNFGSPEAYLTVLESVDTVAQMIEMVEREEE